MVTTLAIAAHAPGIKPGFLPAGNYKVPAWKDDINADKNVKDWKETLPATNTSSPNIKMVVEVAVIEAVK